MEALCDACKKEEMAFALTCNKCKQRANLCVDCNLLQKCPTCDLAEKLKSEEEFYFYMFFQPEEEEKASILNETKGKSIKNEGIQIGKKNSSIAGFTYPLLTSIIPIEKIPGCYSASCPLGGYSFIVTGGLFFSKEDFESMNLNYIVNGDLEMWELYPIPVLRQARHCHGLVVLGERLYVLGGINKVYKSPDLKFLADCEYLDIPNLESRVQKQEYPLVSNSSGWTPIALMNVRRAQFGSFVHGEHIYVFGGYSGSQAQENSIERYNPAANKWELIKDVKLGDKVSNPFLAEALVLEGTNPDEFYFLGGTDGKGRSKAVYVYNVKDNKIDEACQLKQARSGAHGFAEEDTLFILGGDGSVLSFEKITIKDGKASLEFIKPDFEAPVESVNFEGIQGLFFGSSKIKIQTENLEKSTENLEKETK